MYKRKGCGINLVLGEAHATRAKDLSSTLVERRSVTRVVLHWVPNELACGMDRKRSFLSPGKEQSSLVEVSDTKRSRPRLLLINILHFMEQIEMLKKKLRHPDIVLVCLKTVADQKVEQNRPLDNIHHSDGVEDFTVLILECYAEVRFRLHYHNKQGIETQNAGHFIGKVTQFDRFSFRDWLAIVFRDSLHQQRSLNACNICDILKDKQRLKSMPLV